MSMLRSAYYLKFIIFREIDVISDVCEGTRDHVTYLERQALQATYQLRWEEVIQVSHSEVFIPVGCVTCRGAEWKRGRGDPSQY